MQIVVGLGRLELPTSRLSGVRSNHLSYKPVRGHIFLLKDIIETNARTIIKAEYNYHLW